MKSITLAITMLLTLSVSSASTRSCKDVTISDLQLYLPAELLEVLKDCRINDLNNGEDLLEHALTQGCVTKTEIEMIKQAYGISELPYYCTSVADAIDLLDQIPVVLREKLKECDLDVLNEDDDILEYALAKGCVTKTEVGGIREAYGITELPYFSMKI